MTADLILPIALVVLVIVGIWAVVEVALTMRSARRDIDELTSSAREVIGQAQPVVAKLDGVVDELEPAAKRLTPLLERTEGAVGDASESLQRLNGILEDVSSVSGAASSVTGAVSRVAEGAASGVAGVVSRLRGSSQPDAAALPDSEGAKAPAEAPERRGGTHYVDYGEVTLAPEADDTANEDQGE